jgi:hypothetical protein
MEIAGWTVKGAVQYTYLGRVGFPLLWRADILNEQ